MNSKFRPVVIIIAVMILLPNLTGCSKSRKKLTERTVFAMDTYIKVSLYEDDGSVFDEIEESIRETESRLSVTDPDSDISGVNKANEYTVSDNTAGVIKRALELCEETDGALDISIYPVVKQWGFTTGEYQVPDDGTLKELLKYVDYKKIILDGNTVRTEDGMEIDPGAVGKGYMGDVIAEIVERHGISSGIIDLGGNIRTIGKRSDGSDWRVAVRSPDGTGILGIILSSDESVITSGGYERYFIDNDGNIRWHIMDPSTGSPVSNGVVSVTVVGSEGIRCDALSTALFVMGKDDAVSFWKKKRDFDMIIVTSSNEVYITPGLAERFEQSSDDFRYYVIENI